MKLKLIKTLGYISLIFTSILLINVFLIMKNRINSVVLKDTYTTIYKGQIFICLILLIFSLDLSFNIFNKVKILRIIIVILSFVILFYGMKAIIKGSIKDNRSTKYAIVLGMALENGEPTKDLIYRIETAADYINNNKDSLLILTGGNSEDGKSEAEIMKDLLLERNVSIDKLIIEDKAKSTKDNFKNIQEFISIDEPITIITSNYHMDRALNIANNAGFKNIKSYPAKADPIRYGANITWEIVLDINELISKLKHSL